MQLRNPFRRTADEVLVNRPERVRIGGCNKSEARILEIREPSLDDFERQISSVLETVYEVANKNMDFVSEILGDPKRFRYADLLRLKPVKEGAYALLADLVGYRESELDKGVEWVRKEMSFRQVIRVLSAYAKVVGFEELKTLFIKAREEWARVSRAEKTETPSDVDENAFSHDS